MNPPMAVLPRSSVFAAFVIEYYDDSTTAGGPLEKPRDPDSNSTVKGMGGQNDMVLGR